MRFHKLTQTGVFMAKDIKDAYLLCEAFYHKNNIYGPLCKDCHTLTAIYNGYPDRSHSQTNFPALDLLP